MIKKFILSLPVIVLVMLAFIGGAFLGRARGQQETLTGRFTILWGDSRPGRGDHQILYLIEDEQGHSVRLVLPQRLPRPMKDLIALAGQVVTARGDWLPSLSPYGTPGAFQVRSLNESSQAGQPMATEVSGPQPWASVLCKFSDTAAEPRTPAYFENMYRSSYPGLDHYWRELSYDTANLFGSDAANHWYTLPNPRSYYIYNNNLDFTRAAQDCTTAADAEFFYPDFVGINLMFNDELDGFAWGGSRTMTLDGITQTWYMTWEPPWGYTDITAIEHEMGHGFGLPHSSYNPAQVYDNRWDVMSDTWTDCANSQDPVFGCLGQHTISAHKDYQGWIAPERKYTANTGSQATITLQQLALPPAGSYLMARIPINGSSTHYYTVEARRQPGYDTKLPGEAVIIHEVDDYRQIPAYVIDIDGNGNTGDAGTMWIPGETFQDTTNAIWVRIESATSGGFILTISNQHSGATLTHTPTRTSTATRTLTPTLTNTSSPVTNTFTPTASQTRTSTATCTLTLTSTPTRTRTSTPTPALTLTPTATRTRTPTATRTLTLTSTATRTSTLTTTRTLTLTPTATRTGSSPPTHTQTLTPTQSPAMQVVVESVWTADERYQEKTMFLPGDEIRYVGDILNSSTRIETADFTWDVTGPCGSTDYYAGPVEVDPGRTSWALPSTVASDACGGVYTYRLSVTFNDSTTTLSTLFTVNSPITPTPTRTATSTPTGTATPVGGEWWKVYLPLLLPGMRY